ncbi:MAG: hypothetical protein WBI07_09580 [Mobilitalea sp.]
MKKSTDNRKIWGNIIGVLAVAGLSLLIAGQIMEATSSLWTKAEPVQGDTFVQSEIEVGGLLTEPVPEEISALLKKREIVIDYTQEESFLYAIISQKERMDYGDILVIFEQNKSGIWERIYDNNFEELKPWKIETADIDGDGITEILTAVYKTTHFDDVEKNRMFIFNYRDGILTKKWTGSEIAGTWKDFVVGDLLPVTGDELIFLQESSGNSEKISIYYWFNFGFLLLADSEYYDEIQSVSIMKENRLLLKASMADETGVILTVKDNDIVQVSD